MTRTCPDCDVALEQVDYDTNSRGDLLRISPDSGGVLGTLGVNSATNVRAYLCPNCDRVLFYAD
ncbi:hypothetical protein ACFQH6_18885 [Halobacteriaceae archaeon GCM10025711]